MRLSPHILITSRQITQFQFIICKPPFRAGQVSCIYAKICIVYLNIYLRFTMGTALSSSRVKTLVDLINEREYLAITLLIQSHSSAAINPGSTLAGTRRPHIYLCKTTSPWHINKRGEPLEERKKLVILDPKATGSSLAQKIGAAMPFCTHLHL